MKLLYVEDEEYILKPTARSLTKLGFVVETADNGDDGLYMAQNGDFDCLILDINLPAMSGLDIARKLRKDGKNVPILFLTAKSTLDEKLVGFKSGADDYLVKPFELAELVARVKALISRFGITKDKLFNLGNIQVDLTRSRVQKNGIEIQLTNKEFSIVEYLLTNRGRVVPSSEIIEHVWDSALDAFSVSETLRTTIKTLRQKIDPKKEIILTYKNSGYSIR